LVGKIKDPAEREKAQQQINDLREKDIIRRSNVIVRKQTV